MLRIINLRRTPQETRIIRQNMSKTIKIIKDRTLSFHSDSIRFRSKMVEDGQSLISIIAANGCNFAKCHGSSESLQRCAGNFLRLERGWGFRRLS